MAKKSSGTKVMAGAFVVLTVLVIVAFTVMMVFYRREVSTMDPTARPTFSPTTQAPPPLMRLPRNLVPESYRVFLQPLFYTRVLDLENATSPNQTVAFTGHSTLSFWCAESTSSIFLHSRDLQVSSAALVNRDDRNQVIGCSLVHHQDQRDFLEVQLDRALVEGGNYSLSLDFEGQQGGLFISSYTQGAPQSEDDLNATRFLAATHLEPTLARTVFPCLDEPEMKAVFHLTVAHRRGTKVLGNAEISGSHIVSDDWIHTEFHPTPRMSTYLFALAVSEFDPTPSAHERVDIQIYARPEAIAAGHAQYAANITGKILQFYEDYLGIRYTQKKLDQIALPDLSMAAMENWGLVTYQEGALLYEEGVSSLLHKEAIASIIAHELAHQWFGNLVTMKWWNEIWLNEGFASYMTYLAVDAVEPSFQVKDTFVLYDLMAFEEDALASARPLAPPPQDVQSASEIEEMFDVITYSKGAMVLKMLSDIVDENVFHAGVKTYLRAFEYNNTDQQNLWDHIQKAVDHDGGHTNVAMVMNKWTNQPGFPVVTIDTRNGTVRQQRFLFNDSSESSLWWDVPIRTMSKYSQPSLVWLKSRGPVKKTEFLSESGNWILANINCSGYYIVNYDPENWKQLLLQLETDPQRIPLLNRVQLISDAFSLARAKMVDVTLALNSTRFLRNETQSLPWISAINNLDYIIRMFDLTEVNGPMQAYLRDQVRGLYLYFKNYTDHSTVPQDHASQTNQINVVKLACSSGLPECVFTAQRMFSTWMRNNTNVIQPNLRSVIYCEALAAGGRAEWEFAWEKLQASVDTSQREQLRDALSCTRKTWLLNRLLSYTLDPEKFRVMDIVSVITAVAQNPAGQALAWNFMRANWEYVSRGGSRALIEGVTQRFSTQFELEELLRFAEDRNLSSETVTQAEEQTRVNIQWVEKNRDSVLQWFLQETAS